MPLLTGRSIKIGEGRLEDTGDSRIESIPCGSFVISEDKGADDYRRCAVTDNCARPVVKNSSGAAAAIQRIPLRKSLVMQNSARSFLST